jgi:hypothetical protein
VTAQFIGEHTGANPVWNSVLIDAGLGLFLRFGQPL